MMSVRTFLILVVGMMTLASAPAEAQRPAKRTFRIMVVADGESELFAYRERLLEEEILEVLKEDANVVFVKPQTKTNWTYERAEVAVKEALGDRSVDLVIIFGPMSGVAVGRIEKLSRPVVIPYAAPKLQGLPQRGDSSGQRRSTEKTTRRSPWF